MRMLHAAIKDFERKYGKDAKYKAVLESLGGARDGLNTLHPEEQEKPSPGRRAAQRIEKAEAAPLRRIAPKDAGEGQPKSFEEATAQAKERLTEAPPT